MLYVTDSVGKIIDAKEIERHLNGKICTAIVDDSFTKCVTSGFQKSVNSNLENPGSEHYKYVVISAPTKDISDIFHNEDDPEKKCIQTSERLMSIAENVLKTHKYVEKVVLVEHQPRFDHKGKANLSQLANNTLYHLRALSSLKNKIFIGSHTLQSFGVGKTFENRYHDIRNERFDGIHLFGPTGQKDYTESIIKIMLSCFPELKRTRNVAPLSETNIWREVPYKQKHRNAELQHRNQSTPIYVYTQNRFQPLNQGNY